MVSCILTLLRAKPWNTNLTEFNVWEWSQTNKAYALWLKAIALNSVVPGRWVLFMMSGRGPTLPTILRCNCKVSDWWSSPLLWKWMVQNNQNKKYTNSELSAPKNRKKSREHLLSLSQSQILWLVGLVTIFIKIFWNGKRDDEWETYQSRSESAVTVTLYIEQFNITRVLLWSVSITLTYKNTFKDFKWAWS